MKKFLLLVILTTCLTGLTSYSREVIAGWDRFSNDGTFTSPGQRSSTLIEASLSWAGTDHFRDHGSNDGTFGSIEDGAETDLLGAGISAIRWNNGGTNSITITVSNTSPSDIILHGFHFDAFREWNNSWGNTYMLLTGGDISTAVLGPETLIQQSVTVDDGTLADFQDVDIDITGLENNNLASGQSAIFTLACWGGTFSGTIYDNIAISGDGVFQTNLPPSFSTILIRETNARVGQSYAAYLINDVSDPEDDPLHFSRISGPAWLSVSVNGVLAGQPLVADMGTNSVLVEVSDGSNSSTGTVQIIVQPELSGAGNNHNPYRPNVVIIMADDIGLGDIGFYHRERTGMDEVVPSPHLDSLIEGGMRFHQANTPAALCSPTRYSVMTGNYCYRASQPWGDWWPWGIPNILPGQPTVGSVMQDAGYRTAFFGKYGMSSTWTSDGTSISEGQPRDSLGWNDWTGVHLDRIAPELPGVVSPKNIGFDYTCSLQAGIQETPDIYYENDWWMPLSLDSIIDPNLTWAEQIDPESQAHNGPGDSHWNTRQVGPILTQKAVDFIDDTLTNHPGKPFFLYYCSQAVHHPHTPPDTFDGMPVKGFTLDPYGDMIYELDLQVGKIIQRLKDRGVYTNTLFIFTSDNGGLKLPELENATNHDSSNGLRDKKSSIYEGGHRVPFIAVWPGYIPANTECPEPIMTQDLLATLYALTGQMQPEDAGLDSFNILPLLLETPGAIGRDHMMLQGRVSSDATGSRLAIRQGGWKLILQTDKWDTDIRNPVELFNMAENPVEDIAQNLVDDSAHTNRVALMLAEYNRLRGSDKGNPILGTAASRSTVPVDPTLSDSDADGIMDEAEVIAGTDPFDSSSLFEIHQSRLLDGMNFTVGFHSVTGRLYSVQWKTNLMSEDWQLLTNVVQGGGEEVIITNSITHPAVYYRIQAERTSAD